MSVFCNVIKPQGLEPFQFSTKISSPSLKANWGNGFSTVLVQFVPKLRHAGVTEETIRKILVDNPRRFLTFVPKQA